MTYLQKIIYHKSDISHTGKNLMILKLSIQVTYFINWLFRTQIKHMIVVFTHLHIIKPILKNLLHIFEMELNRKNVCTPFFWKYFVTQRRNLR